MKESLKNQLVQGRLEAGCDEAGRGCLAGPVYAAAVILPENHGITELNDSKQLSTEVRARLCGAIEQVAISWAIGALDPREIDRYNILRSSFMAMHRAIDDLDCIPEHLLIDGNRFLEYESISHTCIVGGDGKMASIAAASILAKHHRDEYMIALDREFPEYQWKHNKGYPTPQHRSAIERYGPTEHHRRSFRLYPEPEQVGLF